MYPISLEACITCRDTVARPNGECDWFCIVSDDNGSEIYNGVDRVKGASVRGRNSLSVGSK